MVSSLASLYLSVIVKSGIDHVLLSEQTVLVRRLFYLPGSLVSIFLNYPFN